MNKELFSTIQIVLSILLIVLVLLQAKGTGLGSTFGGDFSFYHTKRGVEKILFRLTLVIVFLFLVSSVIGLIL